MHYISIKVYCCTSTYVVNSIIHSASCASTEHMV